MTLESVAISTNKYIKTVNAKIDEHVYVVHKMGAGTQLDLSREISALSRLRTEVMNLDGKLKSCEDEDEQGKLMDELGARMEEFSKAVGRVEEVFVGVFDDGEDGKKSRKLVHTLGLDNIQKVYDEIWEKAENGTEDE